MRRIVFPLLFLFAFIQATAQNTPKESFTFKGKTQSLDLEYYGISITKSNLENYRLKSKDVDLLFENGLIVTLISAEKAVQNGISLPLDEYQQQFPKGYLLPIFSLTQGGQLLAKSPTISKETLNANK